MTKPATWIFSAVVVLCSSCATTLPESSAQRQAVIGALERYHGQTGEVLNAKVKVHSSRATVRYTLKFPPVYQLEALPCRTELLKTNETWVVQSDKTAWPWYNKVFGVK